jgi:hypothetical protein
VLSSNSLLARILERDKAEIFGPSERFVVGGFGIWISVELTTSELLISTFGSATSAFSKLVVEDCVLLSETCLVSTIE